MRLEVRKVGNSLGVLLPKQIIHDMHLKKGDELYVLEVEDGITLTPYDPNFDKAMAAYDEFAHRYRNALKELAKK